MYIGRDRLYLREQRERTVKRKEKIIKARFNTVLEEYNNSKEKGYVRGMLDKGKIHCSCRMCKYEKHHKIEKDTMKAKKTEMKNEINEYKKKGYRSHEIDEYV